MSRQLPSSIRTYPEAKAYMQDEVAQVYGPGTGITVMRCSDDQLERLWRDLPDRRPSVGGVELLHEAGVPLAHHAVARMLSVQLPADHPASTRMNELAHKGDALTADEKGEIDDNRHLLDQGGTVDDEHEDGVTRESTVTNLQHLREAGVPLTREARARLPKPKPATVSVEDVAQALRESGYLDDVDPQQCLRDAGVPTKAA